jgi:hypothetical protein
VEEDPETNGFDRSVWSTAMINGDGRVRSRPGVLGAVGGLDFDVTQFGPLALGGFMVVLGSGVLALLPLLRANPRTFIPPMMFNNAGNMGSIVTIPLVIFFALS